MALTPEQLKAIQDYYAGPLANARPYQDAQGNVYQQDGNGGYLNYGINASQAPGAAYQRFGSDGAQGKDGAFIDQDKGEGLWKLAAMAAIGGGAGYGAGLFGGGAGAAGGAAAGAGGGSGAFLGEGALSGIPAWDGALTAAQAGAVGGGAGAGVSSFDGGGGGESMFGGGGGEGGSGAFLGENAASGVPAWDSALASAHPGVLGGSGAFLGENVASGVPAWDAAAKTAGLSLTGAAPGFMDSLKGMLPSGASSLLGPLATVGGALLGSQGNKNEASSTKTMDPRLDGPVFGAGGVVPQAQGLLAQQMTPQAQQGWLNMQNVGQSLLSRPIAGNGFGTIQRK